MATIASRTPPISSRATLIDVARRAQVARSTVSAILGNRPHCYASQETRKRVQQAATELNYVPNRLVDGIRHGRLNLVGLAIRDLGAGSFSTDDLAALEVKAADAGCRLLVTCHHGQRQAEHDAIRDLLSYCVRGMLVEPIDGNSLKPIEGLSPTELTVVTLGHDGGSSAAHESHNVFTDHELGGYLQASHVLKLGRRNPMFLLAGADDAAMRLRLRGYQRALREAKVGDEQVLVLTEEHVGPDAVACGAEMTEQAIASGETFDAVIASSDAVAAGAMRTLMSTGRSVPTSVSIIGYGDAELARATTPTLTTVKLPNHVLTTAYDLLERPIDANAARVALKPTVVIRES